MPDMLVKLYELPDIHPVMDNLKQKGIEIRQAIAPEKHVVVKWVTDYFGKGWASECEAAFSNHPVSCCIAIDKGEIVGFACYEATYKDFFGPTGVREDYRGRGIGKALLLLSLHSMAVQGYGYAIIGGAGPTLFYSKTVGATIIEESTPGIYKGMLKL